MLKTSAFYIFSALFIFAGQFLMSSGLATGKPPHIAQVTLNGHAPMPKIQQGPALLYFWAEWCGVCRSMQDNVNAVAKDYPSITVSVRSGKSDQVSDYLVKHKLDWAVVNDENGAIGKSYGVRAVPAMFFVNRQGNILFTSVGYTSEWGLRFRLWLAGLL